MQKEIKYTGFSASPSDYECLDGDLSTAVGLVPEDSTLKPLLEPKEEFTLGEGEDLFYIHKGNGYTHYITKKGQKIYYGTTELKDFSTAVIHEASSVGNTLIVLTSEGMHYFLWINGAYKYLGDHLPELPLQFGLCASRYSSGAFSVQYPKELDMNVPMIYDENYSGIWGHWKERSDGGVNSQTDEYLSGNNAEYIGSLNYSDELKNVVTQGVMAQVNKAIADKRKEGKFMFPFFVRYAYRLYDGSLTMHSAPVLMTIASQQNPYVAVHNVKRTPRDESEIHYSGETTPYVTHHVGSQEMTCVLYLAFSSLYYKVLDAAYKDRLSNWSDIISSIDIFISEPLWTIDQSGLCVGVNRDPYRFGGHSICQTYGFYSNYFEKVTDLQMFNNLDLVNRPIVKMPLKTITREQITAASRFYLLTSILPENLNGGNDLAPISIPDSYLLSLNNRELMTDDYDSHDNLIPTKAYPYNARLDITGLQKKFNLYHASSMLPYSNGDVEVQMQIWVFIKTDQGERVIESLDNGAQYLETWFDQNMPYHYLYFPYSGAYKAVFLRRGAGSDNYREIDLLTHPNLNGAYFFSEWNISPWIMGKNGSRPQQTSQNTAPISLPNKLYTSEVNNPFFFPVSGIVTIGAANILDICSAARPLSEGQFGQFPLYAFTDEGVWALELSNDGTYKARQPITRDVCISPESITQMDTAVLFATDRGVMLISGSTSTCISDSLTSPSNFNPIEELKNLESVIEGYADENSLDYVPFLEYVKGCRMIYDYVHQRIIVFHPEKEYAYVYSLKSKQWGMMASSIKETTNSYPDALAVVQDGTTKTVVDYTEEEPEPEPEPGEEQQARTTKAVLVTRPLKLDAPDVLKTVNTVITRGNFQRGHVKTILYGSRDLINWQLIGSSVDHYLRYLHGTPYKYFRIVLLCDLDKGENVTGSTIEYTPRLTDQVR